MDRSRAGLGDDVAQPVLFCWVFEVRVVSRNEGERRPSRAAARSSAGRFFDPPVQPLVQPFARRRARRLDVPLALAQRVQPELVRDLRRRHGVGQVLLVGEHQEHGVAQLVLLSWFWWVVGFVWLWVVFGFGGGFWVSLLGRGVSWVVLADMPVDNPPR